MYKPFILILFFFITSCANVDTSTQMDMPCWTIFPPEKCTINCNNTIQFKYYSSAIDLAEKIYTSTVENDLKIKIASELFSEIASNIESKYDQFKTCEFLNEEIICKNRNQRSFRITTEGKIGLGHINIEQIYWKKIKKNHWKLFGLGKISKDFIDTRYYYTD